MRPRILAWLLTALSLAVPTTQASELTEAAASVAAGSAVLVDVREVAEWKETGVPAPAVLLAKSEFDRSAPAWRDFLAAHRDKKIFLICRSGNRAGQVARRLEQDGYSVGNLGGLRDWQKAGLPIRDASAPATTP